MNTILGAPGRIWLALPSGVQKAVTDALETGAAAALAVEFALPGTLGEAQQTTAMLWAAFAGATIAALRRGLLRWITARRQAE